jgi:nucleoid-associated protein Lsr2
MNLLDDTEYEIDLNAGHANELRDALARYAGAARRLAAAPASQPAATAADRRAAWTPPSSASGPGHKGIEVKDRGRGPAGLVVKFKAAMGQG